MGNLSIMTLFRAYWQNILKALGGGNSRKIPSIESIQDLNFIEFILDIQISATMTTVIKNLLYLLHYTFVFIHISTKIWHTYFLLGKVLEIQ